MDKREADKPFSTEEGQLEGSKALCSQPDTTAEFVEEAVTLGKLINDGDYSYIRWLMSEEGDLSYQVFRGPEVPERFWGTGEYGLCLLAAAETVWKMDKPVVSFAHEIVRPEAAADDPTKDPEYPPHYYGGYMAVIMAAERKPGISDERIARLAGVLDEVLKVKIGEWSGSNGS